VPGREANARYEHEFMRNLKITLAYDGSEFHGWQVQPEHRSIQGTLAEALARITGSRDLPQGSGRTDAGVHALGQVASIAIASTIPAAGLRTALNDTLPAAIRVLSVEEVGPEFHARRSARAKTYRYRIYRGDICPPFLARYVYHPYPLDEGAMCHAASQIVGEHDFTSFAAVDPDRARRLNEDEGITNVRTIFASAWQRDGDEFVYTVRGSGFLHHMVRNLVGTFLLIGKGSLRPEDVGRILCAGERSANPGATVPARGLYLVSVEY
jgi:tRNA pseudouridine38-40 synthase